MLKNRIVLGITFLLLSLNLYAQEPAVPPSRVARFATLAEVADEFQVVPCRSSERESRVRELFKKNGAADADIESVVKGPRNLKVVVKGASDERIVVGAHYDLAGGGCGAIDNWTGIVAITRLFGSVRSVEPEKTIEFIAFAGEESGLLGSKSYVSSIPKQGLVNYCAMINLDSFSSGTPFVMANASDSKMQKFTAQTATDFKIPYANIPIPNADADSSSFLRRHIPAITITGLTGNWHDILHTPRDQAQEIKPESVYLGYRLALALLQRLDHVPCHQFR